MNKWGIFTIPEQGQIKNKFAEYGISVDNFNGYYNSFSITFSDGAKIGEYSIPIPSGKVCVCNDEKHVIVIKNNDLQIPFNSRNVSLESGLFSWVILPTINDDIYNFVNGGGSTGYVYDWFNIPKYITELSPSDQDLILYPVIAKTDRGEGNNTGVVFFKDLYFCLQRQFKIGDVIKTSNGDEYISLDAWLLFKM